METTLQYEDLSCVSSLEGWNAVSLFPNLLRDRVSLRARIAQPLAFRDAMLSLRNCIKSELYVSSEEIIKRANDPLITVSNERVYFEAFSMDESTYARLTLRRSAMDSVEHLSPGCTNIDFSQKLADGLMQMRSSRLTFLEVGRSGMALHHEGRSDLEMKIDLPDSWMRGFLEVQAALRRPAARFEIGAADLRNLLVYLKKHKETVSPRGLKFTLTPGETPSVTIEPWGDTIKFRQKKYVGEPSTITIWGRRRLFLLEKLLPSVKSITALFLGTGKPSFWICELGDLFFLLGLSPWTSRDWTNSKHYQRYLSSVEISSQLLERTSEYLKSSQCAAKSEIAEALSCTCTEADAALDELCLKGYALYDLETDHYVYRRVF